jgi:hypothetical protein
MCQVGPSLPSKAGGQDGPGGEHGYQAGRKGFHEAETTHFVAILVWDCLGSVRYVKTAVDMFRQFAHLKHEPKVDTHAVGFLQLFINTALQKACQVGVLQTLELVIPEGLFAFGAMLKPEPWTTTRARFTPAGCIDLTPMFQDRGKDVLAAWEAVACHGQGRCGLRLASSTMKVAFLGDVIALVFAELGLQQGGAMLGFAMSLCAQFGKWLSINLDELVEFKNAMAIPELRGAYRARNLDPRDSVETFQGFCEGKTTGPTTWKDRDMAKVLAYGYNAELNKALSNVPTLTLTMVWYGWRSVGEAMDLYFAYSPAVNLGGWLPFQVPPLALAWICDLCLLKAGMVPLQLWPQHASHTESHAKCDPSELG